MGRESRPLSSSVFSINVSAEGNEEVVNESDLDGSDAISLLQQILIGQERQNELLETMIENMNASQRQRSAELGNWRQSNPDLSERCRKAADILSEVQTEFLDGLATEVEQNSDTLRGGEFMLNEFVDRFGPRLAHLNGVLQVLSQLSAPQPSN